MKTVISESISNKKLYLYSTLTWSAVTFLNLFVSYIDRVRNGLDFDFIEKSISYFGAYSVWIVFTPLLYRYLEKRTSKFSTLSFPLIFLGPLIIIVPIYTVVDLLFYAHNNNLDWQNPSEIIARLPAFFLFFDLFLYIGAFGGSLSIIYYRKSMAQLWKSLDLDKQKAELDKQLSDLKLTALQSQLEPHFLFNSLNSISSLVRTNNKDIALKAIRQLSELLRYVVSASQETLVELKDEIEFVKDYMALQGIRYGSRIHLTWHIKGELTAIEIPPFLLHTLLENVIVHAVEINTNTTDINVNIDADEQLEIKVTNSGEKNHSTSNLGVGLNNLKQRLELAYNDQFTLHSYFQDNEFHVLVMIPIED